MMTDTTMSVPINAYILPEMHRDILTEPWELSSCIVSNLDPIIDKKCEWIDEYAGFDHKLTEQIALEEIIVYLFETNRLDIAREISERMLAHEISINRLLRLLPHTDAVYSMVESIAMRADQLDQREHLNKVIAAHKKRDLEQVIGHQAVTIG